MRDPGKAGKLLAATGQAGLDLRILALDVTSDDSVAGAIRSVLDAHGHVDVLVNNAGIAGNAVTEECPIATYRAVMDANLYGAVRCIQAVLPVMRERQRGCIVNISSVVGRVAVLAQAPYTASKWALEGMSEALAHEVAAFGIRVAIVEPGITRSAIFAKNVDAPNQSGAYDGHYRRMFQFYAAGIPRATPAEEVAEVVLRAITTDRPMLRYAVSWGGPEMIAGRAAMTDEAWVALGAIADDAAYHARFKEVFGLAGIER
jgi:NAD(P)-dependent dehydrogenase (short-subunit alcohol dehydrogenase family)